MTAASAWTAVSTPAHPTEPLAEPRLSAPRTSVCGPPLYRIAVRELCAFAAKRGNLDLRFTPAPTAQEGIAGHQLVAARRGAGHVSERALSARYQLLLVSGRADGFDPAGPLVEEVKTHKGDLSRQPANHRALHWAQARVYGWLLCHELDLPAIDVALVYLDIVSQRETVLREPWSAADLRTHFEALCAQFLAWAAQEQAHRDARNAALAALRFPHGSWRSGQRLLADNVYTAAQRGRCLVAQAPTGIGKTLGTLFPLLKASPAQALDKLCFLTAKGSGQGLALAALASLRQQPGGLPLRVLALQARDKACEHPDKACHGDSCPLAQGFYDRLPAARAAAVARLDTGQAADTAGLRTLALAHGICPYYLTQELVRWADVVVGDYHYQFDASALLPALAQANGWRVALLVDEAHNLVERARDMYSAELDSAMLKAARHAAPGALQRPLQRVQRAWNAAIKGHEQPYQVLDGDPPEALLQALQLLSGALADWLADHPEPLPPALQTLSLAAVQFSRLAETFGPHALLDLQRSAPSSPGARAGAAGQAARAARATATLCIRNLVPAPYLAPRLAAAHCSVLFSATLTPQDYYANTLGLPADTAWLDVPAPFAAAQLQVRLVRQVSTRWQHRAASVAPIVALVARQYRQAPGNYLAFFSSFDYLDQVAQALAASHPDVPMWCQTRGMADAERSAFLARFTPDGAGIGFAVLGGAFAEGIDLPGRRLIGAFIATLGLPQLNPVNEAMRARLQAQFGAGYDYTYLYPGLRKVVQAAGRVIRTPQDQGVVCLIDDRFARPEVRALLPGWWVPVVEPG